MKHYTFLSGHVDLEREQFLTVSLYAESADAAKLTLIQVLMSPEITDEGSTGMIFELVSSRELEEDEKVVRSIHGIAPNNGHTWDQSY
jgi:hypothetical protein